MTIHIISAKHLICVDNVFLKKAFTRCQTRMMTIFNGKCWDTCKIRDVFCELKLIHILPWSLVHCVGNSSVISWFPTQRGNNAELWWCIFKLTWLNLSVNDRKASEVRHIKSDTPIWRHCNDVWAGPSYNKITLTLSKQKFNIFLISKLVYISYCCIQGCFLFIASV